LLKGHKINLKLVEKCELPILHPWFNDPDFNGEFESFGQVSLTELEKIYENLKQEQWYWVEKTDGTKVGYIAQMKSGDSTCIGYLLLSEERGKGYGSEAVQIMVDYLFLHKDIVRIQAETHPDNIASQRVLEKAGFMKEGLIRKSFFSRGIYRDTAMWSILREEWVEPKILPIGYTRKA